MRVCLVLQSLITHFKGLGHLIDWGRVTHMCVGKLTTIDSDNGLSPERRQAIIWIDVGILVIGTNFSEFLIGVHIFSFKKMHSKMPSAKWRPFCLGLNVLTDLRGSLTSICRGSEALTIPTIWCRLLVKAADGISAFNATLVVFLAQLLT